MTTQPSTEEQKYATFPPSSVQIYAESIGLPVLPQDILSRLAEDVSYRVREVVSKSCEFMRCSRRKHLKSSDIDRALKWSHVQPMSGVSDSLNYESVDGIYYTEDAMVDLKELALGDIKPIQRCTISLSKEWLPKTSSSDIQSGSTDDSSNGNSEEKHRFEGYYTSLVECVLSDNDTLFELMLNDIKNNPRIGPMVTYLVSFLSGANIVSHDLMKLSRMLFVLKALLNNHYISIQLYLKPLLKAVIYCVVESLSASINPLNDHWLVRDYGALLAAELIYSHADEVDILLEHAHSVVSDILEDATRPLCSHYGAIILTSRLGVESIQKLLLPRLAEYVATFLQPIMYDLSLDNVHMKSDAQMVFGACTVCIERLHYQTVPGDVGLKLCCPYLHSTITDLFGDSLPQRLPLYALSKSGDEASKNNISNTAISWQHYSLSKSFSNVNLPSKRRKMALEDVFSPIPPLKRYRPIRIAFGIQKPHTYQRHMLTRNNSHHALSRHQLHLVHRIVSVQKSTPPCSLLAWL